MQPSTAYEDIPGFCKVAPVEESRKHGHVLTPGRYIGAEQVQDDGEAFDDKMKWLVEQFRAQQAEAARLDAPPLARICERWAFLLTNEGIRVNSTSAYSRM